MKNKIQKDDRFLNSGNAFIGLEAPAVGELLKVEIYAHAIEVATGFTFAVADTYLIGDDGAAGAVFVGQTPGVLIAAGGTAFPTFSLNITQNPTAIEIGLNVTNTGNANLIIDAEWTVTRYTP
jgi:hypothetical protein